jgi:sarcosine oxidase subunit alpha
VRFTFDGRAYLAREGDTAASALLAAGEHAFGRSVKYRRLRGVLSAGPEEPNALLTVGVAPNVLPNVPASCLQLRDGMVLRSQNRWPSLRWDLASLLQAGSGYFGAGFYYKTFMWPSWRTWESPIRRLAGLGAAPDASDLPQPRIEHQSCDVLVAGAGAAGLAAALAAARAGARVIVLEREAVCGGELEFEHAIIDGQLARDWTDAVQAELLQRGARIHEQTALVGGSGGLYVAHREPGGLAGANTVYRIRPRAFVMALGAVERPIAFVDNDRPGVMLLGAAERYATCFDALHGRSAVIFANHDRSYAAAARLLARGVQVRAIVDTRVAAAHPTLPETHGQLASAGVELLRGQVVTHAAGRSAVQGAVIAGPDGVTSRRTIACDLLLVSGGWTPALHPAAQDGGARSFESGSAAFVGEGLLAGRYIAGAAHAIFELGAVLRSGHDTGVAAARFAGKRGSAGAPPVARGDDAPQLRAYWRSPCAPGEEQRQFVDPQNDVTVADLRGALAEGYTDIEHVKRYTALGFGTDQGRIGGTLGAAIVADMRGETLGAVGISRPRPPYHPVTLRSLAGLRSGEALRVTRRTPLHDWHASHGGVLDPMGLWMRPRYYRANGDDAFTAAVAEARRVRRTGGILDGSTLGKIEIAGSDAAAFLDATYLTRGSTLKPGRAKYMVNLREDGRVLDDGLALRHSPDRFVVTTSSGHAGHMLSHLEHYRDLEWPGRAVTLTDVTDAWSVIAVAGPRSRAALHSVLGADWSAALDALRHMDHASGQYTGRDLTLLRAGFSGELAFELHVRPAAVLSLWQALVAAGLEPYGLDALDILRVEKGYLTTSEINGETTPQDLGMETLLNAGNACVGRDLLDRPALTEPARPRLVGLRAVDGHARFLAGAQLTVDAYATRPCGHVTSCAYSPALEQWIGLALVSRSLAIDGQVLVARDPLRGAETQVRVCPAVHFDPQGERMKS